MVSQVQKKCMIITYKYKLYKYDDHSELDNIINISSNIWNHSISLHKRYYRLYHKHLSKFQLQAHLTKLKNTRKSFWKDVPSQSIQNITDRIELSYQAFFDFAKGKTKIKRGVPSFRKREKYQSFTLKKTAGWKYLSERKIRLNKHEYRFVEHRKMDLTDIKTIVVKRKPDGSYWIFITGSKNKSKALPLTGQAEGFDFGLKTFLTVSDGEKIYNPQFFKTDITIIKRLNRQLSRRKNGSNRYYKAKIELAKAHSTISDKRDAFHWETALYLVKKFDHLIFEDLDIESMKEKWGRKVSDLAFTSFLQKVEYLSEKYSKEFHKIDRYFPSSQLCSCCGGLNPQMKDLKTRTLDCVHCKSSIDRDDNASINIKNAWASHSWSGYKTHPEQSVLKRVIKPLVIQATA